jgi:hypothetical protein
LHKKDTVSSTGLLILIMPYGSCQFSVLILEKVSYF